MARANRHYIPGYVWRITHRYRIIDLDCLMRLLGFADLHYFQSTHNIWVESSLQVDENETHRQSHWTDSIAVGSQAFIEEVKMRLGFKVKARSMAGGNDLCQLRENLCDFGNTTMHGFESVTDSY